MHSVSSYSAGCCKGKADISATQYCIDYMLVLFLTPVWYKATERTKAEHALGCLHVRGSFCRLHAGIEYALYFQAR